MPAPPSNDPSVSNLGLFAGPGYYPGMDEAELLRSRNRLRRQAALALTPGERLAKQAELTEALFARLRANPQAWARFLRRNYRKRSVQRSGDGTA